MDNIPGPRASHVFFGMINAQEYATIKVEAESVMTVIRVTAKEYTLNTDLFYHVLAHLLYRAKIRAEARQKEFNWDEVVLFCAEVYLYVMRTEKVYKQGLTEYIAEFVEFTRAERIINGDVLAATGKITKEKAASFFAGYESIHRVVIREVFGARTIKPDNPAS